MHLRAYQKRAIGQLYNWFKTHPKGFPCVVLPTGSGKSWVIAHFCKDAITNWPETRILILSHVKEILEQDAEKLRLVWENAPMGIYSASIGQKQIAQITYAGIQSIRGKANDLGHVDIIIIDECHLVSHNDEGEYRKLINALTEINPAIRVVGFTATPYRLGHGMITDEPAIFDEIIEPATVLELIKKGFLSPLRSKVTDESIDTSDLHTRGGEFIESEMAKAIDKKDLNYKIVDEIIRKAGDRKAWLIFCVGIDHARHIADILTENGINAAYVTGETPKDERDRIVSDFRAGDIRALTNANVLSTGFDYPDIDLIAMLRPTKSKALYIQQAGRGMRLKSHTDHCLVLDFAGNVRLHGPITSLGIEDDYGASSGLGGEGGGEMIKECPSCGEILTRNTVQCPECGHEFLKLRNDDIMGNDIIIMDVKSWQWAIHESRTSGMLMIKCKYYGKNISDEPISEYFPVLHDHKPDFRDKKIKTIKMMARTFGVEIGNRSDFELEYDYLCDIRDKMNSIPPPKRIEYQMKGRFANVKSRDFVEILA